MGTHINKIRGKYDVRTSAPSAPKTGDRYFDSTKGYLCYYDGSDWICHRYTSTSSSTTTTTSTSTTTTTSTTSTSSSTSTVTTTSTTL